MAVLKRRLQKDGLASRIAFTAPGEKKLSEALLDLVSPYTPYADTLHAFGVVIGMGVTAWNLTLLEGSERQSFFENVVQPILTTGSQEDRAVAQEMFSTLVKRKEICLQKINALSLASTSRKPVMGFIWLPRPG